MIKLCAASTLVAASAAAVVIGLGAPAFASAGSVAHSAKTTCYCELLDHLTDAILNIL